MNNYKLAVLFFLKRNRINKIGKCPIRCRITFKKTRKEFSTGIFISPDYWDSGKQKASPPGTENALLNNKLSGIYKR